MSCLLSPPACAGSYTVVYSGGTLTNDPGMIRQGPIFVNGKTVTPYATGINGYGSQVGTTQMAPISINCAGQITALFTWHPAYLGEPAPASVVVTQHCVASCFYWGSSGVTAPCDNGLNGPVVATPLSSGSGWIKKCDSTVYSVQSPAGDGSLTLTCLPSAGVNSAAAQGGCSVFYTASVSPVTVTLGGTTKDSSGNQNILVGQSCTASLSGIPSGTVSNYSWSVSGTTFQTWSADTPPFPVIVGGIQIGITPENPDATYEVDGPGPLTNPSSGWYWNDLAKGTGNSTQETVSCTATVTPPTGQGAAFPVTATTPVTVWTPKWTGTGSGSAINVDNKYQSPAFWLYAGVAITGLGPVGAGMSWKANLSPPPSPVSFGVGSLALVQIVTSQDVGGWTNTTPAFPMPYTGNGQTGLDTSWPYPWETSSPNSVGTYYTSGDSPGLPVTLAQSAHDNVSFEDHLMYCPPGSVQYVPVAKYIWSANMSATLPATGNWINFTGSAGTITDSQNAGTFLPNNTFPVWTQIVQ